ncbi:hypothetical protein HYALB_00002545 [Hymenoscyphus albidus]|uniref:Uncharacterized protein n=1 Tax=Hymenoscyphus albidus TaxID=595503 RepID=A0A9N9PZJ5_9HELO|nr:hypothetical protein HYALB_00002545 [Hymenoscyphus albidus]
MLDAQVALTPQLSAAQSQTSKSFRSMVYGYAPTQNQNHQLFFSDRCRNLSRVRALLQEWQSSELRMRIRRKWWCSAQPATAVGLGLGLFNVEAPGQSLSDKAGLAGLKEFGRRPPKCSTRTARELAGEGCARDAIVRKFDDSEGSAGDIGEDLKRTWKLWKKALGQSDMGDLEGTAGTGNWDRVCGMSGLRGEGTRGQRAGEAR